ncbi:MAG: SEL1-like repeat protein [Hyphomicrobiaceae bacterium]|nr:SEL1-like repeat protein [Hyphomicrobiaceae bacterium]
MALPQHDRGSSNTGRQRSQRTIGDWLDELVGERGSAQPAVAERREPRMPAPQPAREDAPAQSRRAAVYAPDPQIAPERQALRAQAAHAPQVAPLDVPAAASQRQPQPQPQPRAAQPSGGGNSEDGLEARLSRLSEDLSTLERRAGMTPEAAPQPQPQRPAASLADQIRAQKHRLDFDGQPAQPQAAQAVPASAAPVAPAAAPRGTSDLVDEVARLSRMIDDIRGTAEQSVEIGRSMAGELPRLGERIEHLSEQVPATGAIQRIEGDVALLRQAISQMPTADAISALEEGYSSVLERLEALKVHGIADTKIDQLYTDVNDLRDAMDRIEQAGQESTRAALAEMKALTERIERGQGGHDPQALARALEEVSALARKGSSEQTGDALAAVVERLVSLESRISDLAEQAARPDALVATLADIKERIGQISNASSGALELDRRLGEINQRFDRLDATVRDGSVNPNALADLSRRIEGIAELAPVHARLQERLDDLQRRLDDVSAIAASNPEIVSQVAALARRVDALAASMPMRDLERGLLELSERVNGLATEAGSRELASVVHGLAQRVERLVEQQSSRQNEDVRRWEAFQERLSSEIGQLGQKIEDVARQGLNPPAMQALHEKFDTLSGKVGQAVFAPAAIEQLEKRIAGLIQRQTQAGEVAPQEIAALRREIEALRATGVTQSGAEALQAVVQKQIHDLAERIETARNSRDMAAIGEIETQMNSIVSRLDQIGDVNAEPMGTLRNDLMTIRDQHTDSGNRMLDVLSGLQTTMQTVVHRLEALESDDVAANAMRDSVAEALVGAGYDDEDEPTPAQPVMTRPAQAAKVAELPDLDLPDLPEGDFEALAGIDPAAGDESFDVARLVEAAVAEQEPEVVAPAPAPEPAGPAFATPPAGMRSPAAEALERASRKAAPVMPQRDANKQKASFIAAARRAAQQAAAEAAQAQGKKPEIRITEPDGMAVNPAAKKAETKPAGKKAEKKADKPAGSRLRPLLIAASVLAIAAGTYAIFMPLSPSDEPVAELPAMEAPVEPSAGTATPETAPDEEAAAPQDAPERDVRVVGGETVPPATAPEAAAETDPLSQPAPVEEAATDARFTPQGEEPAADVTTAEPAAAVETAALPVPEELTTSLGTPGELPEAIGPLRLRVAAVSGDPAAAFEIATRYTEGRFVPQDLGEAALWYARGAEAGLAPAAYRLGSLYERGNGVPRNPQMAASWYAIAAEAGNPKAMHNLAVLSAEGINGGPDFAAAAHWFTEAANRGLGDSQFNLGVLYAKGLGVEQDLVESYIWFALAAIAGDADAGDKRDEVAAAISPETLALAQARVERWSPVPVARASIEVDPPAGGWEDGPTRAATADTPELIRRAQELLAQRGYTPGPADGVSGPQTVEAVRAFQRAAGLAETGSVDQQLLDVLAGANR